MATIRNRCGRLTMGLSSEAKQAYADAGNMPFEQAMNIRKMMWKARTSVSPREFAKLAKACIPDGYNEYDSARVAKAIARNAPHSCVQFAREYSPAVYVRGPRAELEKLQKAAKKTMRANEMDFQADGALRLWWD